MEPPKKFMKLLDVISEQLFYHSDRIVILDQFELEKNELQKQDVQHGLALLKEKGIVEKENVNDVWKEDIIPSDYEDRELMLNKGDGGLRQEIDPDKRKYLKFQIALLISDGFEKFYEDTKNPKENAYSDVLYDSLNGVMSFQGEIYKAESATRKSILSSLWDNRKVIEGSIVSRKGEAMAKTSLAVQSGLIESARDFQSVKDDLKQHISQLNNIFKKKKFPLHIGSKGGAQLTVNK